MIGFEHIHTEIVSSAVSSLTISTSLSEGVVASLDGDRDKEYGMRWWLVQALAPGTAIRYLWRPNAVTSGCKSNQYYMINNANNTFFNGTEMDLYTPSSRNRFIGEGVFFAATAPGGVGMNRSLYHRSNFPRLPINDVTDQVGLIGGAAWGDNSANLTSFQLAAEDSGGTPQNAIGVGSVIEVWRIKQ